jgi:hypothetical protein
LAMATRPWPTAKLHRRGWKSRWRSIFRRGNQGLSDAGRA